MRKEFTWWYAEKKNDVRTKINDLEQKKKESASTNQIDEARKATMAKVKLSTDDDKIGYKVVDVGPGQKETIRKMHNYPTNLGGGMGPIGGKYGMPTGTTNLVTQAIKDAKQKKQAQQANRLTKEEVDQIDEISREKVGQYSQGASAEIVGNQPADKANLRKRTNREKFIKLAYNKYHGYKVKVPATNEETNIAEDDDWEGQMAKTELSAIREKSSKLIGMLNDQDDLEAWVQSKISQAKMHIDSVHDYLVYGGEHKSNTSMPSSEYSQSGNMASSYGDFMNRMGEGVELDEAKRGRPRKNAAPDGAEEGDGGAERNIVNQLKKRPQGDYHVGVGFANGKKADVHVRDANKILNLHLNAKTAAEKESVQTMAGKSHEHLKRLASSGKPDVEAPKPRVTLGSLRKESMSDPSTMQTATREFKMIMTTDADGRPKLIRRKMARKDIKIEALVGGQKNLDKNRNGRLDKMDFKLLRKKMSEAEEMTTANVARAAATQTQFGVVGNNNMQQDSVDKMQSDPLASKQKIKLPPTQGNKPIGGDTQTHANVAEEIMLNKLYNDLSEENKLKFDRILDADDGIEYLLNFAREQGF
jgi:hypothetical protein